MVHTDENPLRNLQAEARLSHKWLAGALAVFGIWAVFWGDSSVDPATRLPRFFFALLLYALAFLIWMLDRQHKRLAPWVAVLGIAGLLFLGLGRLHFVGFVALLAVPPAVAVAYISLEAALAVALLESLGLALGGSGLEPAVARFAIMSLWSMVAALFAIHQPDLQVAKWAWSHYRRAQRELDAARERNADLDQVLDELMHANRQLDLLNERLAVMRAMAEEAQRTKAAFVAKVSHELRTPLNMIIGLTDLLVERPEVYGTRLPAPLLEDLRIVHRNCEHLASMINDVLDLSQTESGRLMLRKEWGDLAADVAHAADVVRPLVQKKGLFLELQWPAQPVRIQRDQTRIRQVLLNLLSNAARYTQRGGITVRLIQEERHAIVSVADTGPGIPAEDIARIFEPFYQSAGAAGRAQEGNGLGLSISKQFVELHDGQLWLESEEGVGTTFYIKLPLAPAAAPTVKPEGWIREEWMWLNREARQEIPRLPHTRRIIVYDETDGCEPICARCPEEVELLYTTDLDDAVAQAHQVPAHLLLLNAGSPARLLKLLEAVGGQVADTPILGCVLPSQFEQALAMGATDYLIKPITRADLVEALTTVGEDVRQVLIVDDDPDVRQLLARMLHTCDPELAITMAADGEEALAMLRQQPSELVLLDIMLPRLNGWQLLAEIQRDPALRTIPVIVVSAQDPADQPVNSPLLVATMGSGLGAEQILHGALGLAEILLTPHPAPDPAHG